MSKIEAGQSKPPEIDRLIEQAAKRAEDPAEILESLVKMLKSDWEVEKLTNTEILRLKTYIKAAIKNNQSLKKSSSAARTHNRVTPIVEALDLYLGDYGIDIENLPNFNSEETQQLRVHLKKRLKLAREEMFKPYLD